LIFIASYIGTENIMNHPFLFMIFTLKKTTNY